MCFEDETIEVPQSAVKTLLEQGATCGSCDNRCCPDETGDKIDMCLNGNTINVSRNACQGILTAGGTCGPCEEKVVILEKMPETAISETEEVETAPSKTSTSKSKALPKSQTKKTTPKSQS